MPDTVVAAAPADGSLEGRRLGPWLVGAPLGRGGMGTVYAGRRADGAFEQEVAIKLLRLGLDDPDHRRRFEAERRILARLDHPHVCRVLDGGTTPAGQPYLVMERVAGEPIDAWCDARRLGVEARIRLFLAVCDAVQHAHRNLIVHRDLKPSNVLVTTDGRPKLLDFGIAKVLSPEPGAAATVTLEPILTPLYASPEQFLSLAPTTATDVYALGVILFELLTGRLPYALPDLRPSTLERAVCDDEPRRPSTAPTAPPREVEVADPGSARGLAPRALGRRLRGDLDTILLKALRKRPEERYPTVQELRDDLERHLEGLPVRAHPPSLAYRSGRFVVRHRWAVAAAVVLAATGAAGIVSTLRQSRLAVAERGRAVAEARKLEHVNAFLQEMLAAADPRQGGRAVTVAELVDRASARLDAELGSEPAISAALRSTLADTYLGLGLYDEAEREARAAAEAAQAAKASAEEQGTALARLGAVLTARQDAGAAEPVLEQALALLPAESSAAAQAEESLAVLLSRSGRETEAVARFEAVIAAYRRLDVDDDRLVIALNDLAVTHGRAGRPAVAETLHREAYRRMLALHGADAPGAGETLANLAGAVDAQGRHAEAEPLYRQAVETLRRTSGEDHPATLLATISWASCLRLGGRFAEASQVGSEVLARAERLLGDDAPLRSYAEVVVGEALLGLARPAEAEPHLRRAVASRRRTLPAGHWLIASAEHGLGQALADLGRDPEAEPLLRTAYKTLRADRGPGHEQTERARARLEAFEAKGRGRR